MTVTSPDRTSPFHAGELEVQRRVGEQAMAAGNGRVISDAIPGGALPFLGQQSMAIVGSVDADGTPWASALFGLQGFLSASGPHRVEIDLALAGLDRTDPLWAHLERDERLGLLAIELGTRRRLRVNGRARWNGEDGLTLDVDEAYPNCPQYIQRRHLTLTDVWPSLDVPATPQRGDQLGPEQQQWITGADTFFVASVHPEGGADVSHRGGKAGFVQVLADGRLRIPDYAGNSLFNTLGNFAAHPRAGLLFLDFERGRSLQVVGTPTLQFDQADPDERTGGTARFWELSVDAWREAEIPAGLRWEFLDASPFNPDFLSAA